ncbi:MAG: Crp/Fnr family transcriptional regulator [Deltaproteobacteria bacterium]|nr:Crp/Fnr family transcriptional regulator [Deltaproteobacteria bacterium]TLN03582.1 MAG: Crp/Fnr family transcriptional regulator [bacterium]
MVYLSGQFRKDKRNLIDTIPFFSTLSREESDQVEQIIRKRSFFREQVVLNEEDTARFMYIIYSGKVRVVKKGDDGREQILCIHKKGDFFGEMSLLDGETEPATIIAHEDAIIGLLNKNDFEDHIMSHEIIRRKIIDMLCLRLRDAWKMIKILSFDNAEHRIIIVLDNLREHYGIKDDRGIIINIKTTHRMIASYASVSRETVTRKLNKLEKTGIIETLENKTILLKESFFRLANELTYNRRPS